MSIGAYDISTNHNILAYASDDSGNEYYDLVFKDLKTGELLPDKIENISSSIAWCNDNETVYYIKFDDAWRPYQLWRHKLGEKVENDQSIYQEDDIKFRIGIDRTRDDKYMILHVGSAITDEVHYIDANNPYDYPCIQNISISILLLDILFNNIYIIPFISCHITKHFDNDDQSMIALGSRININSMTPFIEVA